MAHKDQNTARTKAARELQAENPGMSYTRAWNIVGQQHNDAKVTEVLKGLVHGQVTVSVTRPDWPVRS